jgi:nitroreductase
MPEDEQARNTITLLRGLRQVRQLRPEGLPPHVIADVLEVARWTGSAGNSQPWELIVIGQRDSLQALARLEGVGQVGSAALAIVILMPSAPELAELLSFDEGRVVERIMLAASAHGVAASMGMFRGAGIEQARTLLAVPPAYRVRTVVALGYPDTAVQRVRPRSAAGRKPLSELVHEERFGTSRPSRSPQQ